MKINEIKVGRNEPCPCDSGYKYKKCCLYATNTVTHTHALSSSVIKESEENIKNRLKKQTGKNVILYEGNVEVKMSEVILDLAEDLLEAATTKAQHQKAIMITCMAWNLAVMFDSEQQKEKLEQLLDTIDDRQGKQDTQNIIVGLIKMKNLYYPDVNRIILDYELVGKTPDFHLNIASTPPPENLKE